MEKYLVFVFTALVVVTTKSCYGQKFSPGLCSSTLVSTTTPAFTITNLAGTWREYARTTSIDRHSWVCTTWLVSAVNANSFTLQIGGRKKLSTTLLRGGGDIVVKQPSATGTVASSTYFTITTGTGLISKSLNYYVSGVDNTPDYIILYACENTVLGRMENAILLVKDSVTLLEIKVALDKLKGAGFSSSTLKFNYQGDCIA